MKIPQPKFKIGEVVVYVYKIKIPQRIKQGIIISAQIYFDNNYEWFYSFEKDVYLYSGRELHKIDDSLPPSANEKSKKVHSAASKRKAPKKGIKKEGGRYP